MERLTDEAYWDNIWTAAEAVAVEPRRDPHQRRLDAIFRRHLRRGARFLEVGAAASGWPVHVARAGVEAWGIDFSGPGLEATRRLAARAGVEVKLVEGDLFDEALLPAGAFDLVYSGGVIEHFRDPAAVLRRLAALATAGGVVVTTVPNLAGLNGALHHYTNPTSFAAHVVHTPATLDRAHRAAGLHPILPARYAGALDLGSVDYGVKLQSLPVVARKLVWRSFAATRRAADTVGAVFGDASGGRVFAPAIIGVYSRGTAA